MNNFEELKTGIKSKVLQALDFSKDISDEEMLELIDRELFGSTRGLAISMESRKNLRLQIFHSIRKLDVLQELVDDPEVTEIMINGVDNIFTERNGRIIKQKLGFESKEKLEDIVQQIVASCNRVVNESSPIVDARLSDGSRVNIVLSPVALNGPIITIRRFPENPMTMEKLIEFGALTPYIRDYLALLVRQDTTSLYRVVPVPVRLRF